MERYKVYFWKRVPISLFRGIKRGNKERLRDYMNVYVCKDFKEMYDLVDKLSGEKIERDYGARTLNMVKQWYDNESGEYVKTSPCCGWIALCDEYLSYETIAHESSHAVIGYFGRQLRKYGNSFVRVIDVKESKLEDIGDELDKEEDADLLEELYCYMVGSLVHQHIANLTKEK